MKRFTLGILGVGVVALALAAHALRAQPEPADLQPVSAYLQALAAAPAPAPSPAPVLESHPARPDPAPRSGSIGPEELTPVVEQYCVGCHNDRALRGNLSLADFRVENATDAPETSERMIRKLRAGMMPPAGRPRPRGDTLTALAEALERQMDDRYDDDPNPGRRTFQRLNRDEYARSIRDMLGLEVDVSAFLPAETMSQNFDNIADVQMLSPTLMEGYLRAASQIARDAVGDPNATPSETTYKVPRTASQLERVEGAPFGTRGGTSVMHTFPADGDYIFKIAFHPGPTGFLFGMTSRDEVLEVSIDGERVATIEVDRWMSESDPNGMNTQTEPIHVFAGPHRVTAAFIDRAEGPVQDVIAPIEHTLADTQIGSAYGVTTLPHLRDLGVAGPFTVTGVSDTPSRRRVFSCRPTSAEEELPCAEQIVSRLATQAYRRPVNDDDMRGLMSFYAMGVEDGDFESGIRTALQAILASPHFVFRLEEVPGNVRPGRSYEIGDIDLASRLSFFLWSAAPDPELLDVAARGKLSDDDELERQVRRMLADPRSEALATRFAAQWLRLQDLEKIHPDALIYPHFDATLAESMRRETELFFDELFHEDRSLLEILTADWTWVNGRLARHYGIPNVGGDRFQRVMLTDPNRRGLLGQGSILTMTSHADRTSPVLRGKWVMEVFLNSPPPPPPPNVPDLEQTEGVSEGRLLSVRERMEQHRRNPACRSCHQMMDPIGLALEYFDVTGAWRVKDNGVPIDAVGELFDGTALTGPADLRAALLARPEAIVRTFAGNLMAYAIGRRIEYYDQAAVRAIAREAAKHDYRMSEFVLGVVRSPAFRMARAEEG